MQPTQIRGRRLTPMPPRPMHGNSLAREHPDPPVRAHFVDWLTAALALLAAFLIHALVDPAQRDFSTKDPGIALPYRPGSYMPRWLATVIAFTLPVVVAAGYHVIAAILRTTVPSPDERHPGYDQSDEDRWVDRQALLCDVRAHDDNPGRYAVWDVERTALATATAMSSTALIVEVLKAAIGGLRPDFLARCQWDKVMERCMGADAGVRFGRTATPSLHAGLFFAAHTVLALFLAGKLGVLSFDGPDEVRRPRALSVLGVLAPWLLAAAFAAPRLTENKSSGVDVLAGAVIGAFLGWLMHRLYFYSVVNEDASQMRLVKGIAGNMRLAAEGEGGGGDATSTGGSRGESSATTPLLVMH